MLLGKTTERGGSAARHRKNPFPGTLTHPIRRFVHYGCFCIRARTAIYGRDGSCKCLNRAHDMRRLGLHIIDGIQVVWKLGVSGRMFWKIEGVKVRWPPCVGLMLSKNHWSESVYIFLDFGSSKTNHTELSHTNFSIRGYIANPRPELSLWNSKNIEYVGFCLHKKTLVRNGPGWSTQVGCSQPLSHLFW